MQLVVQTGAEPGRTYDLEKGQKLSVGRQSVNQIVVSDEQVSRRHAEVELSPGGVIVTDLDSSNGTFVNGTRVSSMVSLKPGDTLQVGTTVLKLVDNRASEPTLAVDYQSSAQAPAFSGPNIQMSNSPAPSYNSGGSPGDYGAAPAQNYQPAQAGYNSQAAYAQAAEPPAYGQMPPASEAIGQSAYGQNQAAYAQPLTYGQAPPVAQPGSTYGQPDPQAAYAQPQIAPAKAPTSRKTSALLITLLAALVALLIIGGLVFFLFLNNGGELPKPNNATRVEVSSADQDEVAKNLKNTRYNFYTSTDDPNTLEAFYKDKMKAKGYSLDNRSVAGRQLIFTSGDKAALVLLAKLDRATIDSLEGTATSFKGKLREGETLVGLTEGKSSTLTT